MSTATTPTAFTLPIWYDEAHAAEHAAEYLTAAEVEATIRRFIKVKQASEPLRHTPANQLTVWLRQAREQAQALPVQPQLQQVPTPPTAAKAPASGDSAVRWSGTLVLSLPGAP